MENDLILDPLFLLRMTGKQIDVTENSWVIYLEEFIACPEDMMKIILLECDLEQEYVKFGDKEYPFPRLTAWYGDKEYTYSGKTRPARQMPNGLLDIQEKLKNLTLRDFSSVLLNYYRTGQDSVSWHSDDEPGLGPTRDNIMIASVSLGAPRRFVVKNKETKEKREWDLGNGSLLIMGGKMQEEFVHQIPKTSKKVGPRLNLTYRIMT